VKAVVIGATGLVGRELVRQLLAHPEYEGVRTLSRRPLAIEDDRIEAHRIDFGRLEGAGPVFEGIDHVFSCFGTTLSAVGRDRDLFRQIDLGYPLASAKLAARAGVDHFVFVSSVEADPEGPIFQSRVKGDLESALAEVAIPRITAVQPSLLDGRREKVRWDERFLLRLFQLVSPLLRGRLRTYRPIAVSDVARDMILAALQRPTESHMRVSPIRTPGGARNRVTTPHSQRV